MHYYECVRQDDGRARRIGVGNTLGASMLDNPIRAFTAMASAMQSDLGTLVFVITSGLAILVGFVMLITWRLLVRSSEQGYFSVELEGHVFALALGLAVFCAIFSIGDIVFHVTPLSGSFPSKELPEGGTWGLRITSLLVGYKTVEYAISLIRARREQNDDEAPDDAKAPTGTFARLKQLGVRLQRPLDRPKRFLRRLRRQILEFDEGDLGQFSRRVQPSIKSPPREEEQQYMIALTQYGIYVTVMSTLWSSTVFTVYDSVTESLFLLLAGIFFFIIDDWAVIFEYSHALKGYMMRSHTYRIHGSNLLMFLILVILMVTLLLGQENHPAAFVPVAVAGLVGVFLFLRYFRLPVRLVPILNRTFLAILEIGYVAIGFAYIADRVS